MVSSLHLNIQTLPEKEQDKRQTNSKRLSTITRKDRSIQQDSKE